MLSSLTIDNIALISHGEIGFSDGFVVFTGETGAGKSIIIDSISLILGARANRELIRSGEEKAKVEALFQDFNEIEKEELSKLDIDITDGQLLLSREICVDGRSFARINGRTVTVSMLKEVSQRLVNIHGQHECQMLTDPAKHLELLDLYAENTDVRNEYARAYKYAKDLQKQIIDLNNSEKQKNQRIEYLKFVIKEIDDVSPKENELELLEKKKNSVERMQVLNNSVNNALDALNGNEDQNGAYALIKNAACEIEKIKDFVNDAADISMKLNEIADEISDINSFVSHIALYEYTEYDSVDKIEERIYSIEQLCRKYGGNETEVLKMRNSANAELNELANIDKSLKDLALKYNDAKTQLSHIASKLSESRKKAAVSLCEKVCDALEFLDMSGVKFYADIQEYKNSKGGTFFTNEGTEKIEFYISANVGEEPKPLAKIASGGELSRIILAIKSALNEKEGTGTLIFDEIDTGISGKTSYKVGVKLLNASKSSQVFCVTHSAQIASLADMHIKVSKSSSDGRSYTVANELDEEEHIMEIARIMGGDIISDKLVESAKELINQSKMLKTKS